MSLVSYVFPLLMVGLMLGYSVWMRGKVKQGQANMGPAFTDFYRTTGFVHEDMPGAPPEAQAERSVADSKAMTQGSYKQHLVRPYHGLTLRYRSSYETLQQGGRTTSTMSNQWQVDLPHAPRVTVHIADKRLDSTLKAVGEMFSNSKRVFQPQCSQRVTTGIPQVDDKFVVFGEDPNAVRQMLQQNPALVQLLGGWEEVDVAITPRGAFFADPTHKNMQAAMGGALGSMAMGFDISKRMELSIPVHDRVGDLLATLVRASA
jgi:hypothetical protein